MDILPLQLSSATSQALHFLLVFLKLLFLNINQSSEQSTMLDHLRVVRSISNSLNTALHTLFLPNRPRLWAILLLFCRATTLSIIMVFNLSLDWESSEGKWSKHLSRTSHDPCRSTNPYINHYLHRYSFIAIFLSLY